MFIMGFIAPYSHIPFNRTEIEGVFGFSLMSSFLFAVGFPLFCLVLSFLLHRASNYVPGNMKKAYRIFSYLTSFTGFYFIVWAVNPYVAKDFHPLFYYGSMILISVSLIKTASFLKDGTEILKEKIRYLMNVIVVQAKRNGHIVDNEKYREDIIKPVINKLNEKR